MKKLLFFAIAMAFGSGLKAQTYSNSDYLNHPYQGGYPYGEADLFTSWFQP